MEGKEFNALAIRLKCIRRSGDDSQIEMALSGQGKS